MHEKNGTHQQHGERLRILHRLFAKVFYAHTASRIRLRVVRSDTRSDCLQLGPNLFNRNTPLHFSESVKVEISSRIFLSRVLQRHPQIGSFRKPPSLWHHADNGDALAIDGRNSIDDVAVRAEMVFPYFV